MTTQATVAPSDDQLDLLRSLCEERGYPPAVVYSKQHASEVIAAILDRSWTPPEWQEDVPF
jgi:hypothetical protein